MIVDTLVGLVVGLVQGLIALIPDYSLPSSFTSGSWMVNMSGWWTFANAYFPMDDLALCLAGLLGARLVLHLWVFFWWCYNRFPLKAT